MNRTKPTARRDAFTVQKTLSRCKIARNGSISLDTLSAMLLLFFLAYTTTPYLHKFFDTLSNLLLSILSLDSSMDRALLLRILASLCTISFSGLLYIIALDNKKKSNSYTAEMLTAKLFLRQFVLAIAILIPCGLIAAVIEKLYLRSGTHTIQADVLPLYTTISGLIILVIDTALLAFKEELIYRAIPGYVVSTFLVPESISTTQDNTIIRPYSPDMFVILIVLSIPFGLAHRGLGAMFGSLLAGTAFLYLVAIKKFRWWILAIAHTMYNLLVLTKVSI